MSTGLFSSNNLFLLLNSHLKPPLTPSTSPPLVRLDLPEPQGGLGAGGGEALAHPLLAGHEVLRAVERAPRLTVPHLQLVDFRFGSNFCFGFAICR